MTPQEVWSSSPLTYSDLKIFGCLAYAHVDNGKLEPRSMKCIFLGYKSSVQRTATDCQCTRDSARCARDRPEVVYCDVHCLEHCAWTLFMGIVHGLPFKKKNLTPGN